MRLTADLINTSLSYINPLLERELDLRGHKIPTIENLGVAKDHQDAIDLTDNDIAVVGNFPLSPRLRTLMLARNRVAAFQPSVASNIPNLETLVLTQNNLSELADLDPLAGLKKLTTLVLMGNPVAAKENYRNWIIWRFPTVRFLDFQRVRDAERKAAKELFGTGDKPTELASKILGVKSARTFEAGSSIEDGATAGGKGYRIELTDQEKKKLQKLILNTNSLTEIARLEKMLEDGKIPTGLLGGDQD